MVGLPGGWEAEHAGRKGGTWRTFHREDLRTYRAACLSRAPGHRSPPGKELRGAVPGLEEAGGMGSGPTWVRLPRAQHLAGPPWCPRVGWARPERPALWSQRRGSRGRTCPPCGWSTAGLGATGRPPVSVLRTGAPVGGSCVSVESAVCGPLNGVTQCGVSAGPSPGEPMGTEWLEEAVRLFPVGPLGTHPRGRPMVGRSWPSALAGTAHAPCTQWVMPVPLNIKLPY